MRKITTLIIMDGYGLGSCERGNAIGTNCSPFIRYLRETYPNTTLEASGEAVGLPNGQMGNSEVGHLNIGAGRIVYQELLRISNSIKNGDFFENAALIQGCQKAKGHALHLFGLLSDGGVHSHISHLFALLQLAKRQGVEKCFVHVFCDGRDTSPTSGIEFVAQLEKYMSEIEFGQIATVCGRYYAMDRDNRWDRVKKAYDMLTLGKGNTFLDAHSALQASYDAGVTDEFVLPTVIVKEDGKPVATVQNGDSVIFYNFRADRAREMTKAFTLADFDSFSLKGKERKVHYTTFTNYDELFTLPYAFADQHMVNTLGEYLAKNNIKQLRTAETEKYAHVTFFFNGGVEEANEGETRLLVPSPKVATYDLMPEMSARFVTDKAIAEMEKDKYDFVVINFANCDMVGHTGSFEATCQAVSTVDESVRLVTEYVLSVGGRLFVTADHGNAEKMLDGEKIFTAHTTNKVPFIFVENGNSAVKLSEGGALCDIAPTVLTAMGLDIPAEMTGRSLIE